MCSLSSSMSHLLCWEWLCAILSDNTSPGCRPVNVSVNKKFRAGTLMVAPFPVWHMGALAQGGGLTQGEGGPAQEEGV